MRLSKVLQRTGIAIIAVASGAAGAAVGQVPPPQHYGDVSYRTGGVGEREEAEMRRIAQEYPLTLTFVERAGDRHQFSAGQDVTIEDSAGRTVLEAEADGPFMHVDLPPERYTITAEIDGHEKTRQASVSRGSHQRVVFEWAAAELEQPRP